MEQTNLANGKLPYRHDIRQRIQFSFQSACLWCFSHPPTWDPSLRELAANNSPECRRSRGSKQAQYIIWHSRRTHTHKHMWVHAWQIRSHCIKPPSASKLAAGRTSRSSTMYIRMDTHMWVRRIMYICRSVSGRRDAQTHKLHTHDRDKSLLRSSFGSPNDWVDVCIFVWTDRFALHVLFAVEFHTYEPYEWRFENKYM